MSGRDDAFISAPAVGNAWIEWVSSFDGPMCWSASGLVDGSLRSARISDLIADEVYRYVDPRCANELLR